MAMADQTSNTQIVTDKQAAKLTYVDDTQVKNIFHYIGERVQPDRITAPQLAVRVVREAIVTGALASGAALRQDVIAAELGISKIPVREALREIEGQGLARFIPNRGFVVKETSYEEMIECFKLRRMLEVFAVRESVLLASATDLDKVERLIDAFEAVTDPMVFSHWNLRIHLAFYAPSGMKHLEEMITRAHTIAQRYTHIYMRMNPHEVETQDEHRAILAAYRRREIEAATMVMDQHIAQACDRFAAFLAGVQLGLTPRTT